MVKQEEMTDSEIIELLSEYNFKNQEISEILRNIKHRDVESVLNQIEEIRKQQGSWEEQDREKKMEEMRKRNDLLKMEEERNERYKQQLIEKIKANRIEQKIREEQENQSIKVEGKPFEVSGDIKARVYLSNGQEIFIGFDADSTVKDLYSKVAENLGSTSFVLQKFGLGENVENSSKKLLEVFNARAFMLEVSQSNK